MEPDRALLGLLATLIPLLIVLDRLLRQPIHNSSLFTTRFELTLFIIMKLSTTIVRLDLNRLLE